MNTSVKELEVSFEQFIRSKWFAFAARIAAFVSASVVTVGASVGGWIMFDVKGNADRALAAVIEVRQVQEQSADMASLRSRLEDQQRIDLKGDVTAIQRTLLAQQNTLGDISGQLRALVNKDASVHLSLPSPLAYGPPTEAALISR